MPFREPSPPVQALPQKVRDALTSLAKGAPVRVVTCDPERELHVVAHASLVTLVPPLFLALLCGALATLTALPGVGVATVLMSLLVLVLAKWGHFRWLAARRQGLHFVRGRGLTLRVPGLGLTSRRVRVGYARLLGKRDGRVFDAKEWLRYGTTRRGKDTEGRPIMVEDRSVIAAAHVQCMVIIDGESRRAFEVIAGSYAEAKRTIAALDTIFAAFAPAFAADEREAAIAKIEAATPAGSFERHRQLGGALLGRRAWATAEAELVRATELDPAHAMAWNQLGRARSNLTPPQLDAAIACFERSIELDPKPSYVHANLALVLRESGRREDALRSLDRAIACAEAAKDDKDLASLREARARWTADAA